jgi:hypothetical protein
LTFRLKNDIIRLERIREGKCEMAKSRRTLQNELRLEYLGKIMDFLAKEEDVLRTGSNELAFPVTDSEGNEEFIQIVVKVPTGSRDGEPYNGYQMAEEYSLKLKLQQEKAEKARIAKEKKIARDAQMRKEKEKAKKMKQQKMEAKLEKGK